MKKVFTQKLGYLALSALLFAPQIKAGEYTDILKNPGFEHTLSKDGELMAPTKENNKANFGIDDWFRFCPYGWKQTVIYNGNEIEWDANNNSKAENITPEIGVNAKASYGINQDVRQLTREGDFACWVQPGAGFDLFELYQDVEVGNGVGQLPPGEYEISCRLAVMGANNTDRRFTTQRLFAQTSTQNKVQYYGRPTDYDQNLTAGEDATFANWVANAETWLLPVAVTITVNEGETLRVGVKTNNRDKDGNGYTSGSDIGLFKVDGFRIVKKADPNDFTQKILNPNFELQDADLLLGGKPTDTYRVVPYGWTHYLVKEYDENGNPIKLPWSPTENNEDGEKFGNSMGVNRDEFTVTTIMDRGYFSFWAGINGMPEYTIYQDITGLQAGKYQVDCHMHVTGSKLRTQRLFANNEVQFFGTEGSYNLDIQLTKEEKEKFEEGILNISYAGHPDAGDFKLMSVEVDIAEGETLRIGAKSSGLDASGNTGTGNEGMVRIDNFRLKLLGGGSGIYNVNAGKSLFSIDAQENGCWLNVEDFTAATVQVVSLTGQTVYRASVSDTSTWISLPQGLYVVHMFVDGQQSAKKVVIK